MPKYWTQYIDKTEASKRMAAEKNYLKLMGRQLQKGGHTRKSFPGSTLSDLGGLTTGKNGNHNTESSG